MCGKASVPSQKSVEKKNENGAVEWTKASASLCRNKALVETLDFFAISLSLHLISIVNVDVVMI